MTHTKKPFYLLFQTSILLILFFGGIKPASLSPNILSVLNSPFVVPKIGLSNALPDISYLFTDLKFDGTALKICEFGSAPYAGAPLTTVIINGKSEQLRSPYWPLFWQVIKKYDLPFWWIGGEVSEIIQELKQAGGRYTLGLTRLERDPIFKDCLKNAKQDPKQIKDYAGIVVFSGPERL